MNINTEATVALVARGSRDPFRDFFGDDFMERFFGPRAAARPSARPSAAWAPASSSTRTGYILTNRHVVEGADEISVTLPRSGRARAYDAKLVGKDARTDVALLKIEPKEP